MESGDAFEGRAYLLVGASGGIGKVVGERLWSRGAKIFAAARDEARLEPLAIRWGAPFATLDAGDGEAFDRVANQAQDELGKLDGIVCLAGSILLKPAHLTKLDEWQEVLRQNLHTAFHATRAAGRLLTKEGGSLVLMSSAAAQTGLANHEAISAAKAGVIGLVRSAAATYASKGLRVNAVAPGLVDTPLAARILASEAGRKASESMHPLGRVGRPEDVASAVVWLLDPTNDWVTGQILGVDGGLSAARAR